MNKFIPYEKLSKKKKKEIDAKARRDWNGVSPVTRVPDPPGAYKRAAAKRDARAAKKEYLY